MKDLLTTLKNMQKITTTVCLSVYCQLFSWFLYSLIPTVATIHDLIHQVSNKNKLSLLSLWCMVFLPYLKAIIVCSASWKLPREIKTFQLKGKLKVRQFIAKIRFTRVPNKFWTGIWQKICNMSRKAENSWKFVYILPKHNSLQFDELFLQKILIS